MNYDNIYLPKHISKEILADSKSGPIVTRFPPEPSGYLHLGHIFAVKLNQSIANFYKGKFIVRFDDTNPKLESDEYEKAIFEDLTKLNLTIDHVSYVSDFFDVLIQKATDLIIGCYAYVDSSTQEDMAFQRKTLSGSKFRDNTVEENLSQWLNMQNGKANDQCLRLKAFPDSKNSAMRDPVLYRCLDLNHHRSGNKFKVYPTYDFACPILDSYEGVTHVFRSKEYVERDDQMKFILSKLYMRIPRVFTYGRLEIENAILSKRKIKDGILSGEYEGWDDKKLFTFRGMLKRGFCLEGIDKFLADVGFPENMITIEKQKLFTINMKIADKTAVRLSALNKDCKLVNVVTKENFADTIKIQKFVKNPNLGTREITLPTNIFISKTDYENLTDGIEITLLHFGNMFYDAKMNAFINNPNGNPKTTSMKLIWLASDRTTDIIIRSDNDDKTEMICEDYVNTLKTGDYVQLYKMNHYMVDKSSDKIMFVDI